MRFLVVIVTAVLVSAGSVSAQPRFAVQEPEPARLSEREQRAEDLEDVGLALLITGVGFWALETHHPRELCRPPRPTGQCAVETRGIYTWRTVAAWSGAAVAFGWKLSLSRGSLDVGVGRVQYNLGW